MKEIKFDIENNIIEIKKDDNSIDKITMSKETMDKFVNTIVNTKVELSIF